MAVTNFRDLRVWQGGMDLVEQIHRLTGESPSGGGRRSGSGIGERMAISSFRDLRVWQAGVELVEVVYRLTQTFPRHERFGLAGQMQRAAVSVPSNVAEGHTREYLQHVSVSQASLAESETQFEIAIRLGYLSRDAVVPTVTQIRALGRQLYSLRNALFKSTRPDYRPLAPDPANAASQGPDPWPPAPDPASGAS